MKSRKVSPQNLLLIIFLMTASFSGNVNAVLNNYFTINRNKISTMENDSLLSRISYAPHAPIEITSDNDFITLGFPGSGTYDDPYIIEGYEIVTSNLVSYGISIQGTTKYFIIRNCNISSTNFLMANILIKDIAKGTGTIDSNYISLGTSNTGIDIINSENISIVNNIITNVYISISVSNSPGAIISNNSLIDSNYGISINESPYTQLLNNKLTNQYLSVDFTDEHDYVTILAENNTVDNKPIIYHNFVDNEVINDQSVGQLFLNNCTNINIRNVAISNVYYGIVVNYSENITFTNVTLSKCSEYAIIINYVTNLFFENCTFTLNKHYGFISYVNNLIIRNCTFYKEYAEINLSSVTDGLICNNSISEISSGFSIDTSTNLLVTYNLFVDTSFRPLRFVSSTGCKIYYNIFLNNGGSPQAYDDSNTNTWYNGDTRRGNYWSDWTGMGDYSIAGGVAFDLCPTFDLDNDEVDDVLELQNYGTNPFDSDTDNDGLKDGAEINYFATDPTKSDTDNDGLTDYEEIYIYKTSPLIADIDRDGLLDGEEVKTYGTNPFDSDTDSDGLKDGEEVKEYGTNPTKLDTDGDHYSDYEEILAGTDPNDISSFPGAENNNTNTTINSTTPLNLNLFGYTISTTPDLYGIISLFLSGLSVIGIVILLFKNARRKPKSKKK